MLLRNELEIMNLVLYCIVHVKICVIWLVCGVCVYCVCVIQIGFHSDCMYMYHSKYVVVVGHSYIYVS